MKPLMGRGALCRPRSLTPFRNSVLCLLTLLTTSKDE
jgi:hypothetical protein